MLRDIEELLRRKLQHVGHYAEIHVQALEYVQGLIVSQRTQLKDRHATLFRGHPQRIGLVAVLLRRAENACYRRTPREERFEYALAEGLLSDDSEAHESLLWLCG